MESSSTADKSCGPQLFDPNEPSKKWGIKRLSDYAREQHAAIVKKERLLTPFYWRLGHALELARPDFNHGQWARFLKSQRIEKTRASKARAIYQAFGSAEEVARMSVEAAYKASRAKSSQQKTNQPTESGGLPAKLGKALTTVDSVAAKVMVNVADLPRPEKQALLDNLRQTISRLQDHVRHLEMEIESPSPAVAGD